MAPEGFIACGFFTMAEGFLDLLEDSDMEEPDRQVLAHAYKFLNGGRQSRFESRSLLLIGDTGIGKTYLAERLLSSCLGWNVIVAGASRLKGKNITRCSNLKEIVLKLKSTTKTAVFIDDLDYVMEQKDYEYVFSDKKELMELLEETKLRTDAFLIVTVNNVSLAAELFNRFDSRVGFELPSDKEKARFLTNTYEGIVPAELTSRIVQESIGYNFRDLAEATRMAYRFGNAKITSESLTKALATYRPSGLFSFDVKRKIKANFGELVGKENIKAKLRRLIAVGSDFEKAEKLGLKRHNLLLFAGPNGTGKSAMAKAFAAELGYPLISINAEDIYQKMGVFNSIRTIFKIAKRYRKSVVVFDEADKTLGRARFGDDTTVVGVLNKVADEFESAQKAFIIMIANNEDRLGSGVEDRFTKISFNYPTSEERAEFFEKKTRNATEALDGISPEDLARVTEGKSFRDMEKLWEEIIQRHLEKDAAVNSSELLRIIRELWKEEEHLTMFG